MPEPAVLGLYTAPRAGAPVESCDWIDVQPGRGVCGDRYALKLGHWSDPRWPDQEITLVESEVAAALAIEPGNLRRNIATIGLRLDGLIGVTFQIGEAELTGVRTCDPCLHLESLTRQGLARELASGGGFRARVLRGGRIARGDQIRVSPTYPPVQQSPRISST